MYREFLNEQEVAAYLNLAADDLRKRVKFREIPFQKRGRRFVFDKGEIDSWASRRILNLSQARLAAYQQHSTKATSALMPQTAILPQLLLPEFVAPAITAKTKASVLRDLVDLADATGRLNDPKALLQGLEAREALDPTAVPGGIALPHPLNRDPALFEKSFIVAGRTVQPINFGAPDGQPTVLFFLICCQESQLHLHALARLCLIAQTANPMASINSVPEAESIYNQIISAEQESLHKFN